MILTNSGGAGKRRYDSARRRAAASARREAVVASAKEVFEERGWTATVRLVADRAGVSPKTVEALFGTKASLLQAAVDYAIRGDVEPAPMPERPAIRAIEQAPDARTMLDLHAAHLRAVNERSAAIAWTVETAAAADPAVAELWSRMNGNRRYAVEWATRTLLSKPGRRRGLRRRDVAVAFWVAIDWGTFRTLTQHAGLDAAGYERWLRRHYAGSLLP